MIKRLAAAGLLSVTAAGVLMSAAPAMANGVDSDNNQIIGAQTCRAIDVAVIGAAIHNILGVDHEQGDCDNGSTNIGR
ncbi:hypothetical protein [Actinomadura parmotrematis]|uniref:Chaplin n=1 Tax=Actinomadura parmotrematis TaxID=2864039 RepID=A0ABS7G2G5_9ACTN|nr:hypothetical protein [Actinomadura parmotrematis]MBW8486903.1 hypothetical protein [Actinomadura parmotrematis]